MAKLNTMEWLKGRKPAKCNLRESTVDANVRHVFGPIFVRRYNHPSWAGKVNVEFCFESCAGSVKQIDESDFGNDAKIVEVVEEWLAWRRREAEKKAWREQGLWA